MNFSLKKKVAAAAAAATLIGGVGVAYGYWTSTGSGSGSASTAAGDTTNLSYTQTTLNAMYPGDDVQTFTVTVKNTNATGGASQYVPNVKAYVTTNKADCTGADFKINGSAAPSAAASAADLHWSPIELAPQASAATTGVDTIQFNNLTATNQDACKSAAVTVHYVTTA